MAFIYRYYIKDKDIQKKVNLVDFSEDIVKLIEGFYGSNLKDCRIEKDYYEYKLHLNVNNQRLREFGKQLVQVSNGLGQIWKNRSNRKNSTFFVRRMHEYYAFINIEKRGEVSSIELIDAIDFNELERFTEQSINLLNKYLRRYNIKAEFNEKILDEETASARAFYMDVFTLETNKVNLEKVFGVEEWNNRFAMVAIKGNHRRLLKEDKIIAELDVYQLRNPEMLKNSTGSTVDENSLVDGFQISSIKKLNKDEVDRIKKVLKTKITSATSINKSQGMNYKDINFTVHNVGQALATSLSIFNKSPFIYFDFGISEGANTFNLPTYMTVDVSQRPSIVISHIHKDHWYGITVFTQSFECDWYIPEQGLGTIFRKRCAEIIASGGSVRYVNEPIELGFGTIFMSEDSKYQPNRHHNHKHDNGLAMIMRLYSKKRKNINVLVAGDQRYDYMPRKYLDGIDILVASHHGGEYSWSNRADVDADLPCSTGLGQIIYSFGKDNTHHHPSKIDEYEGKGWTKSHNTPVDLDYKLK